MRYVIAAIVGSVLVLTGCAATRPPASSNLEPGAPEVAAGDEIREHRYRQLVGVGARFCVLDRGSPVCWGGASYHQTQVAPRRLRIAGVASIALGHMGEACFVSTEGSSQCIGWAPGDEDDALVESLWRLAEEAETIEEEEALFGRIDAVERRDVGVPTGIEMADVAFGPNGALVVDQRGVLKELPYGSGSGGSSSGVGAKSIVDVADVATSRRMGCALKRDGRVRCWSVEGWNGLGYGTAGSDVPEVPFPGRIIDGVSDAVAIAVADGLACARRADRGVVCWRVPDGRATHLVTQADQLAAGGDHLCGLEGERVWCLGENTWAQLGDGTTVDSEEPVEALELRGAREIAANDGVTCGLVGDAVRCVGSGEKGAFGAAIDRHVGADLGVSLADDERVHVMHGRTCVSRGDELRCTDGVREGGLHGRARLEPVEFEEACLPERGSITSVRGDQRASCVLAQGGGLCCVSGERRWQLRDVAQVEVNGAICARMVDGTAQCWRYNRHKSFYETNPIEANDSPTPIDGAEDLVDLSMGGTSIACGARRDGRVVCWGWNQGGYLGDGTKEPRAAAVVFDGFDQARELIVHSGSVCARVGEGGVRCVDPTKRLHGYGDGVEDVDVDDARALTRDPDTGFCVLHADGAVTCRGREVARGATSIVGSGVHACARLEGGGVRCWGYGDRGQLGPAPAWFRPRATRVELPVE